MKHKLMMASWLLATGLCQAGTAMAGQPLFSTTINGSILTVTTNIPNRTYPNAGAIVNTPGYRVVPAGDFFHNLIPATDCNLISNGFCKFAVSNTTPAHILIASTTAQIVKLHVPDPTTPVSVTLCLNALGPLSCQTQIFLIGGST